MKLSLVIFALGLVLAPAAFAADPVFDQPAEMRTQAFPATKSAAKATLTCRYYPHFMVKEIDEGEIGAAQLSILPASAQKPPCRRETIAGEMIVSPDDWSGYVKGVAGDYVFFDAEDGVNGGLGFAVFAAGDSRKLFEDSASGDLESVVRDKTALTLRYKRSFAGRCSVPHDGESCWSKIAAAAGLDATAKPDCAEGYLKAKTEMAKARCEAQGSGGSDCLASALKLLDAQRWDEAPSVVVYETESVLRPGSSRITARGGALSCHPSD